MSASRRDCISSLSGLVRLCLLHFDAALNPGQCLVEFALGLQDVDNGGAIGLCEFGPRNNIEVLLDVALLRIRQLFAVDSDLDDN
jgi:hypothetical protein